MTSKLDFTARLRAGKSVSTPAFNSIQPVKSIAQVFFPIQNITLPYFNDSFDLERGDIVYVEGKLKGLFGRVIDVTYDNDINPYDYKKIIGKADTDICGNFSMTSSYFVTFNPNTLPFERVITWFKSPGDAEDEYIIADDNFNFPFSLEDLKDMEIEYEAAERGREYYLCQKVIYLCMNGSHGCAIVEGGEPYTVVFEYTNGKIHNILCSCFCRYSCKHEFAAMLQLRETLKNIEERYSSEYEKNGYFAAISKPVFIAFTIDWKEHGQLIIK